MEEGVIGMTSEESQGVVVGGETQERRAQQDLDRRRGKEKRELTVLLLSHVLHLGSTHLHYLSAMLLHPSLQPCINPSQILTLPASTDAPSSSSSYILSINKLSSTQLLLTHGTSTLTVVDSSSLKVVDTWTALEGEGQITDVAVDKESDGGLVWTSGKEGAVRGWDSRVKGGKISGSDQGKGKVGMKGKSPGSSSASRKERS